MKRKDTSKLLNEWKNFLNEVESGEPQIDFGSYGDPRSVNEDIESILSSMSEEIGLAPDQIALVLEKLSGMSADQIAAAAKYHNERAFKSSESEPLEHDSDLSVFPESDT